ncbi:D-ribose pyranase [Caldisalinibacter kiritimatiensis]|uniref:D-ribose pyranase n=1 Tax=Caldisalinibacter kiritimatiensis TaxID=1304284 RepID=R1CHK7_9FIRM|nr:D-ribose pyranase [Caldisalinibacter kiritimatiensis]EOD01780.1 Ribose ABC transport system, high affinity permease RbsD [Caldisalinibacter kiritimatiensis]
MKKGILLNSRISHVISKMGHTDMLTICDSGLPIPEETERIDLALTKGIPSFLDTLNVVLEELKIEEVIIVKEMKEVSPHMYDEVMKVLRRIEEKDNMQIKVVEVDHEEFKTVTKESKCIVRTGEHTPYANIILKSGVVF